MIAGVNNLRADDRLPLYERTVNNLRADDRLPPTNTKTKLDLTKTSWDFRKPLKALQRYNLLLKFPNIFANYFSIIIQRLHFNSFIQ